MWGFFFIGGTFIEIEKGFSSVLENI